MSLKISERRYTEKEVQQMFAQIMEDMDRRILGQNETLDEVRSDLTLPTAMYDRTVALEWVMEPRMCLMTRDRSKRK